MKNCSLLQSKHTVENYSVYMLFELKFSGKMSEEKYAASLGTNRVGSHVVSVRIHCTENMADFFPHPGVFSKSK